MPPESPTQKMASKSIQEIVKCLIGFTGGADGLEGHEGTGHTLFVT
jgi:hypothetical protein